MTFDRIVAWAGAIAAFGMIVFLITMAHAAAPEPRAGAAWARPDPAALPVVGDGAVRAAPTGASRR